MRDMHKPKTKKNCPTDLNEREKNTLYKYSIAVLMRLWFGSVFLFGFNEKPE